MSNSVSFQTSLMVKHKYGTMAGGCSTKSLLSSETLEFLVCRIIFEILGLWFHLAEATGNDRSKSWSLDLGLVLEKCKDCEKCKVPVISSSPWLTGQSFRKAAEQETSCLLFCPWELHISSRKEAAFHANREIYSHAKIFSPLKLKMGGKKYNRSLLLITGKCICKMWLHQYLRCFQVADMSPPWGNQHTGKSIRVCSAIKTTKLLCSCGISVSSFDLLFKCFMKYSTDFLQSLCLYRNSIFL